MVHSMPETPNPIHPTWDYSIEYMIPRFGGLWSPRLYRVTVTIFCSRSWYEDSFPKAETLNISDREEALIPFFLGSGPLIIPVKSKRAPFLYLSYSWVSKPYMRFAERLPSCSQPWSPRGPEALRSEPPTLPHQEN